MATKKTLAKTSKNTRTIVTHEFPALFDANSEVLLLGSIPSPKSREQGFYYGHPQNRFWRVLAALYHVSVPQTNEEKRALLLARHVALWDSVAACEIVGSSDASIRGAVPNDVAGLLAKTHIHTIFTNGTAARRVYKTYAEPLTGKPCVSLPSTSPANAAWSLERLIDAWAEALLPFLADPR